jgi:acyl phosphate:glycerol-3-phosphate acyltransferase
MKPEYLIPLIGYLLGSIPSGYLLVRITTGGDIRKAGSGNIGATNVFRTSRAVGILTLILDAGKGYLAVLAAGWLGGGPGWQAAAALTSIVGHVFTIFLGFKGGKGVATGFGAFLALAPGSVATTMIVFFVTAVWTRYVSLASILATAAYPLWTVLYQEPMIVTGASVLGAALIVAKHHQNIRRLIAGKENKFALGSRTG